MPCRAGYDDCEIAYSPKRKDCVDCPYNWPEAANAPSPIESAQLTGCVAKPFDATELWNNAVELSTIHETNGYWKALRDLEKLGVVTLREFE